MADRAPGLLETDAAAVRQARTLLACARHGALAVNLAGTGYPGASRVAVASDFDATEIQCILPKPVRQSDLFDAVSAVLGHAAR